MEINRESGQFQNDDETRAALARLDHIAHLLDARFTLPGGIRVGWDGIIGLVPGLGGWITTLASGYIVLYGATLGVSLFVLLRMLAHVFLDELFSAIPLFGWLADFFYRSNLKNVALLRRAVLTPQQVHRESRTWVVLAGGFVFVSIAFLSWLLAVLAWWIFSTLWAFLSVIIHHQNYST